MSEKNRNSDYSTELHKMLLLRYEPIAIKLVSQEDDIPENAIHPKKDLGKHMALCQAFALTRREYKTVYIDRTSEWCWNPLIGFGLVDCDEGSEAFEVVCENLGMKEPETARKFFANFPTLTRGKYSGIVSTPLSSCDFEPDLVLIYSNNAQLRSMALAVKNMTGKIIQTQMDAIDSCVYACVTTITSGEYKVTLPDFGEFVRAAAEEDEIILSVPRGRIKELVSGLHIYFDKGMGYPQQTREMLYDFPRPKFYNTLYKIWGLDQGQDWDK